MLTDKQKEVLQTLRGHTHTFWTTKAAVEFCEPFGVEWTPRVYQNEPNNPKGLHLDNGAKEAEGAGTPDITGTIAAKLGLHPRGCLGRGFQVRADCEAIEEHFAKEGV